MADPLSIGAGLKALNESIGAIWKSGALLLWCMATTCAVVLLALLAAAHFDFGTAPALFKDYSVPLGLGFLALVIFAGFKSYAERPKPILSFIPNYRQSFVHYANQPDGQIHTQFALRFQVTNISDSNVKLSAVRLLHPKVRRAAVKTDMVSTRHPEQNIYSSDYPVLAHSLSVGSVNLFVDHRLGRDGKPMRVLITLQDHRGRWHKVFFAEVRAM